jgi:hypothetical protein
MDWKRMTQVIDIDQYRPKDVSGAVDVTFFGIPFQGPDGESQQLTLNVTVEDGDFEGVIATVRDNGGWYVQDEDSSAWFLPWPCAAVRVEPVRS